MYSFYCAGIRLARYHLVSINIVWFKAKVKRAQRHMKIKEMAKKTSLATSGEEDKTSDTGMAECCIRVVTALLYALSLCHACQLHIFTFICESYVPCMYYSIRWHILI